MTLTLIKVKNILLGVEHFKHLFKINIKLINFIVILCGFFNYIFFYYAYYIRQAKHSGIVRYSYQIKYIKAGTFWHFFF